MTSFLFVGTNKFELILFLNAPAFAVFSVGIGIRSWASFVVRGVQPPGAV